MFVLQERRLAAVQELARLLKPGGHALIYVWAFEQEYNKLKSKYLKDQKKEPEGVSPINTNKTLDGSLEAEGDSVCHFAQMPTVCNTQEALKGSNGKLSVHTNRTAFNTQDLLVPWHLKGEKKQVGKESESAVMKEKRKGRIRKASGSLETSSSSVDRLGRDPDYKQDVLSEMPSGANPGNNISYHKKDSEPESSILKSEPSSPHIFHRYYHVFQQGELEQLCELVAGVKVVNSYHDQGNWCVILEKVD